MLYSIQYLPCMPKAETTQAPATPKLVPMSRFSSMASVSTMDSLSTQSSGTMSPDVMGPKLSRQNAAQAPSRGPAVGAAISVAKFAGKALTCALIAPLVAAWAVVSLVAVVFGPLVGAIVGAASEIKNGPGMMTLKAVFGFQFGLDVAEAASKKALFGMTKFVGLTN